MNRHKDTKIFCHEVTKSLRVEGSDRNHNPILTKTYLRDFVSLWRKLWTQDLPRRHGTRISATKSQSHKGKNGFGFGLKTAPLCAFVTSWQNILLHLRTQIQTLCLRDFMAKTLNQDLPQRHGTGMSATKSPSHKGKNGFGAGCRLKPISFCAFVTSWQNILLHLRTQIQTLCLRDLVANNSSFFSCAFVAKS